MTVAVACLGSKVLAVRDVTVTSPVSGSVFFTAEGWIELLISGVDMMCDAHFWCEQVLVLLHGCVAACGQARSVRRIDEDFFADDDVVFT